MENIIQKHRAFVAGQIEKSFDGEIEKAYAVGDEKDFNGRTYYVHALNAKGQPLWRLKEKKGGSGSQGGGKKTYKEGDEMTFNGRTYYVHELNSAGQPKWRLKDKKTKSDNEKKFKDNFKDASDEVLQKIVEGKIQASDHEKKWATDIINERKKAGKSDAAAKKIIDLLTTSNSKYTDIKKVVAFKTDKGNWAIDYDGANTGLILNSDKLSEKDLKDAGVKIEKPANDPRDKIAHDAGFKDYEEMRGYQNYVTSKNLLKKSSMQAKTKEDTRKKLEADVAKYEKEHADVIAARGGKKSGPNTSNPTDHGNTEDNAYQAYKSGKITKEQYEGITGKKSGDKKKPAVKYSEMTAAQANKSLVGKTIKIGDKTAKIVNAFKSSGPGANKVYIDVVDGDDYLGKHMQMSLEVVESGETKYDNKHFGTKGQKIEISDEEPEKKEVTKESFKEFLNYIQKNIAKKNSEEFLNKEYMFLFTVPQKYRSNAGNVHNRVAATIKKLSDANNW